MFFITPARQYDKVHILDVGLLAEPWQLVAVVPRLLIHAIFTHGQYMMTWTVFCDNWRREGIVQSGGQVYIGECLLSKLHL